MGNASAARGFLVGASIRISILALLAVLSAGPISAQTIALQDTVYRLSEVLVEAERLSRIEDLRDRPTFITILPMDDESRRVTSAAEYLAQTVGFHVRSTGGYGAYSTASVRGSSAKQVSVFLDGVPLNQSSSGVVDLADLPVSSVSRIEVYRGFGAFDLSGSNIGGVVNLVTERPSEGGRGRLSASYGSLKTQRYRASYSLSRSDWEILAIGAALSTEGDFEFLDDNGTPYNDEDDEVVERINNHLEEREAFLKLSRAVGAGTLVAANQLYYRKQGLPGYSSFQSQTEALTKTYDLLHFAWDRPPTPGLPLRLGIGFFYLYQLDQFQDRRAKTATARPDEKNRTTSLGGSLRLKLLLPRCRQALRCLLEMRSESFRPEEILTESISGEHQTRRTFVFTLEDELEIWPRRLRVVPSVRYERYTDRTRPFKDVRVDMASYFRGLADTAITHVQKVSTVGAVASLGAGLSLRGNYGRTYRVPSLMELFGYRGMVLPNPALRPETGLNRDLGFRWERHFSGGRFLSLEYVYFWSEVEELIMYTYSTWARASQAINVDKADIEGYEISLSLGAWRGFSVSGNVTRLSAINTGPVSYTRGKHLPNRPGLEAFGKLEWQREGHSVFYEFDYIGGNYWNAYNGVAPNNKGPLFSVRRLHTAGATVPLGLPQAAFTIEVKNITDERVEDVMGYPMPGRSVYGTLVYSL